MSENYGWCQSCGALVFNSPKCHKCDGEVKTFCIDIELAKQARQIEKLEELLIEYGRHSAGCNRELGDKYRCRCGWDREKKAINLKG